VSNPSKKKGSAWETRLVEFLRPLHPRVERRSSSGRNDRGDIAGVDGWCIEAKNCKRIELGPWLDEAEKEAKNAGVSRFAVVFPRRSHVTAKAYVVMPLWLFSELALPDPELNVGHRSAAEQAWMDEYVEAVRRARRGSD